MKRKMLLLTLAIPVILCQNVKAQTASRLIGETSWSNDGVMFQLRDTTGYDYSAGRGGDLTHTLKYDNSTYQTYDTGTFTNAWHYIQRFDGNNNDTSTISQYWDGSNWVPFTNTLYFYNSANKLTNKIQQNWSGSSWYPTAQDLYSYDVSGHLVIDRYQTYIGSSYADVSQKTYIYNTLTGMLINETDQNYVSSTWIYSNLWDYSYTSANQLLTTTFKTWNGSGWTPATMYTNTYNTGGDMTFRLFQVFNTSDSTWKDDTLHNMTGFSAHNPSMDVVQHNDTGTWNNLTQFTFTYNAWNQMTSYTGISWNTLTPTFEAALGDPKHLYFYETYNSSIAKVNDVTKDGGDANVYPVPAQGLLHVDLKWDAAQTAGLTIFDAQGRVVRHWDTPSSTEYNTTVSIDNLSEGVYFLKISGERGQIVKQLVVAH